MRPFAKNMREYAVRKGVPEGPIAREQRAAGISQGSVRASSQYVRVMWSKVR